MATTIISKVGSGEPSAGQLQQGEIGIDITNKVIWTFSQSEGKMVELAGGDIDWDQIDPDTLPPEIINIINGTDNPDYINLADLKAQVDANTGAIADLEAALAEIEKTVGTLQTQVEANTKQIGTNKDDIATNATNIGSNALAIGSLEGRMDSAEGNIKDNADEIVRLESLINNSLTGLVLGGEYDANRNVCATVTNEGFEAGLKIDQALPAPSEATKGIYVIVTVEGPLSGTGTRSPTREEDGTVAHVGDWLVSDGIHGWILFELGQQDVTFGMIGGDAYDNENLAGHLNAKLDVDGTIDCGNYA